MLHMHIVTVRWAAGVHCGATFPQRTSLWGIRVGAALAQGAPAACALGPLASPLATSQHSPNLPVRTALRHTLSTGAPRTVHVRAV